MAPVSRGPLYLWMAISGVVVALVGLVYVAPRWLVGSSGDAERKRPRAEDSPSERARDRTTDPRGPKGAPAPADPAAAAELVAQSADAGDENARALLDRALAVDPTNEAALEQSATLRLNAESFAEARELAHRCIEANPDNLRCRRAWAMTYAREGEMSHRTPVMRACLSAARENERCLGAMLDVDLDLRRWPDARRVVDEIRRENPESTHAAWGEAHLAEAAGDLATARRRFDDACEIGREAACERARELREKGY